MDTDLDQLNSSLDPSHLGVNGMTDDLLLSHGLDADDLASFLSATCDSVPDYTGSFTATEPSITPSSDQGLVADTEADELNPQQCVCPECGKVFNSVWYLKQHAVKHSNDRPFRCKYCGKTYKFRSNLYQHKCPERQRIQGPRLPRRRKLPRPSDVTEAHRKIHGDSPMCSSGASASSASPGVIAQQQTNAAYSLTDTAQQQMTDIKPIIIPNQPIAAQALPEYVMQRMISPTDYHANMSMLSPNAPPPQVVHYLQPMQPVAEVYAPPPYSYRPSVPEDYAQQYIEQHKQHLHVCRRCKPMQYFPSREYLSRHISWHAERERQLQCSACAELLPNEKGFQEHIKTHQVSSPHKCSSCSGTFKSPIWLRRHYASSARCDGAMPPNEHELLSLNAPKDPYAFIQPPIKVEQVEEEEVAGRCGVNPLDINITNNQNHSNEPEKLRTAVGHALAGMDSGIGSSSGGDVDSSPGTGGSVADSVELAYTHQHGNSHPAQHALATTAGCSYIPVANYSSLRTGGATSMTSCIGQTSGTYTGNSSGMSHNNHNNNNNSWSVGQSSYGNHPTASYSGLGNSYNGNMAHTSMASSHHSGVQWLQPRANYDRSSGGDVTSTVGRINNGEQAYIKQEIVGGENGMSVALGASQPHQYHLACNKMASHYPQSKMNNMITLQNTLTPPPESEQKQLSITSIAMSAKEQRLGCVTGLMAPTPPSSPSVITTTPRPQSAPPVMILNHARETSCPGKRRRHRSK